jgi:IMP dehydrogenase/GMP reductase
MLTKEKLVSELVEKGIVRALYTGGNTYYQIDSGFDIQSFPMSYGFEDIAISQQKNICKSRLDIDTMSEVMRGVYLKVPIIAANMSTVINAKFAIELYRQGAMGILHRAQTQEDILEEINALVIAECDIIAASLGIGDEQLDSATEMVDLGCNVLCVDVANGYTDRALDLVKKIKKQHPNVKIILGNTVNTGALEKAADFIDAIKVGIAQGFACETKNTAGCTEKQFSAIYKFKELSKRLGMPVISDGGIKEPADFVKAIAAGANSVMAGKIFAACPESAAQEVLVDVGNNVTRLKKVYAGMSSRMVQDIWRGGLKKGTCPEGGVRYLDIGESADKLLERYAGALKSGISYSEAKDVESFQKNVKFIRFK